MVASLLSLINSGPENKLLNSNNTKNHQPDIEYYLRVHKRQTRYGRQPVRLEFATRPDFGITATALLPIKGELIRDLYLVTNLPDIYTAQAAAAAAGGTNFRGPFFSWTNAIGHVMISKIDLDFAGEIVATLDGRALEIIDELTNSLQESIRISRLIGRQEAGYNETSFMQRADPIVVRIPFWFVQHIRNALPVDAMAVDPVRIHITFRPVGECYYTTSVVPSIIPPPAWFPTGAVPGMWPILGTPFYVADASGTLIQGVRAAPFVGAKMALTMPARLQLEDTYLIADYVFLDRTEARAMRESELTYTVRRTVPVFAGQLPAGAAVVRLPLRIPGMLQDLMWVLQRQDAGDFNAWNLFTRDLSGSGTSDLSATQPWWPDASGAGLLPNGSASGASYKPAFTQARSEPLVAAMLRFKKLDRIGGEAAYFRGLVPAMYYSKAAFYNRYIYVATVAANPLAEAATGQANMDKIVDCELELELSRAADDSLPPMNAYIYATTVSVLKVYGGRGGFLW